MTSLARKLRAEGRDIVTLSQGEPDFATPKNICDAAIQAIHDGHTKYTETAGAIPLREAIVAKLFRDNGLDYSLDEVVVGCGAKQVIFNAFLATLDAGHEVIIPTPAWVSYPDMVRLAGGTPVMVACEAANSFKLSAEQLRASITSKTKWIVLNSPCNPTGAVYSRKELQALAGVLFDYPDIWVLSDDIYEKIIYEPAEFLNIASLVPELKARTLVVNGVSKAHAMTGWRIGYGAGPRQLIKSMVIIQGQTSSNANSIAQYAAIEAVGGEQTYLREFVDEFRRRSELVHGYLQNAFGLQSVAPMGAFYLFVCCKDLMGLRTTSGKRIETDMDLAMYFLEDFGVAVVPGSSFMCEGYFRVSYAASTQLLEKACGRILAACEALKEEAA